MPPHRSLLVGCGGRGRAHMVGVCDIMPERAEAEERGVLVRP